MTTLLGLCYVLIVLGHTGLVSSGLHHRSKDGQHKYDNAKPRNKLLCLSVDGFRWDYVDKQAASSLPGFTRFLKEGGRAKYTTPPFPALTFPSFTSLWTGLYVESHGIVGNYIYDAKNKDIFSSHDRKSYMREKWWMVEHLFATAEKAGLRTAQFSAYCGVPNAGISPTFCAQIGQTHNKQSFKNNVGKALDKLSEGYDFVQVYTPYVDAVGHAKGPDSDQVAQAVRDVDDVVLYLLQELRNRALQDEVNIIMASDHGMTTIGPNAATYLELDNYLNASLVEMITGEVAVMNIKVPQQNVDQVYDQVSKIPGVTAYKRKDIPKDFHYQSNEYIHEIILLADKGNYILPSKSANQVPPRDNTVFNLRGHHGYRPNEKDMRGIFFAKGPAFKSGWTLDPIHVVDIYQVMAHTLAITPRPHNGTWTRVQGALAVNQPQN